ncbi:SdpA family antimicrobial peptide system protein [Kutzneria sp. NPDC052558]|uniref:SdpA family antimicrobial peptide system protein n=1 Tax=Kutzneria sp. NPDC052558 TaxID=3364121 RepID=UPI0037CB495D
MRSARSLRRRGDTGDEGELSRRSFATTITLLVVSLVLACLTQLSGNAGLEQRSGAYTALWPQGWSFFTGLGSKDELSAYRVDPTDHRLVPQLQRLTWSDRQWGLERSAESQSWELGDLARQIPQAAWHPCTAATVADCFPLIAKPNPATVTNRSAAPALCGRTVITIEHPSFPVGADLPSAPSHIYAVTEVNLTCRR